MNRKVIDCIDRYHMLSPHDHVVVGVSGGADSLALLYFLTHELPDYQLRITAYHINHLLRGEESMRDQRHVEEICAQWGVPLRTEQIDIRSVAEKYGQTLEEAGRNERYRMFAESAGAEGKIATAHTLSDSFETQLFNLVRGCGGKGLCGIPPVRDNIIRPLIMVSREETEAYCYAHGIAYVTDSTNLDTAYSRNKLRLEVIPRLCEINSGAAVHAAQLGRSLSEDQDFLEQAAAEKWQQVSEENQLAVSELRECHSAVMHRVLMLWLQKNGIDYDFQTLDRISEIVRSGCGKINITGDFFCTCQNGKLMLSKKTEKASYFEFPLEAKEIKMPSGKKYRFWIKNKEDFIRIQEIFKNSTYKLLDYDKIIGKLIIRQRRSGDRFRIFDRHITKSIKKLFNEAKIPQEMREKIFLICDERGIIYVEGFGISDRVVPDAKTEKYLVVEEKGNS